MFHSPVVTIAVCVVAALCLFDMAFVAVLWWFRRPR